MIDTKMAQQARRILQTLEEQGFEAYMVGGCVRDFLLGRTIRDIDIATNARPEQVAAIFPHTVPTGLQHGTVTVVMESGAFEVTTFRKESDYEQFRRPERVDFINALHEDLRRRDFTMNAMAIDLDLQLIDPFGGQSDLHARRVRCVGEAEERFAEDALRTLRCIRFASELRCTIAYRTWRAIFLHRDKLQYIAMERVRHELEKIIEGDDPDRGIGLLMRSGLLRYTKVNLALMQDRCRYEFSGLHHLDQGEWRWTALFCLLGLGKDEAAHMMRALTFSRRRIEAILRQVRYHGHMAAMLETVDPNPAARQNRLEHKWKIAVVTYGKDTASGWLKLIESPLRPSLFPRMNGSTIEALAVIRQHGAEWTSSIAAETIQDLAISGTDLIRAGCKPGPRIGSVLHVLLQDVALGRLENSRECLLSRAQQLL